MFLVTLGFASMATLCALEGSELDLSEAVLVGLSSQVIHTKALDMLRDEVEKRTMLTLSISDRLARSSEVAIVIGTAKELATRSYRPPPGFEVPLLKDGFSLWVDESTREAKTVCVAGYDDRGTLFGVGRLLRELKMDRRRITLDGDLRLSTAPRYALRGHQLGYRPKTNSYDAWSIDMWEQYYRDMIVFGMNAVEIVPPKTDDHFDSPHYPLPPMDMMVKMSQLADDYGLDVWIWFPGVDNDYTDSQTMEFAMREREEIFSQLPRIDAVFVPSGDPSELHPDVLFPLMENQKKILNRYHPKATIWSSVQNYDDEPRTMGWTEAFYDRLRSGEVDWFDGMVFGPATETTLPEMRKAVPKRFPIRRYPDITHSKNCQYEIENWDPALANTLGREAINPRPKAFAKIFRDLQHLSFGFISYSEGCNDDVNKIVWSALGWDPDQKVESVLAEYARYFIGPKYETGFAQGLLDLESNWEGPLIENESVYPTLKHFQEMEQAATPQVKLNWRFQQGLYRAYYDAYTKARLDYETDLEAQAAGVLKRARKIGSFAAMDTAESILDRAHSERVKDEWRSRVFELGEALYQSIRMQLSLLKYGAKEVGRGANLDLIDVPLNGSPEWKEMFAEIRVLDSEKERLSELSDIARGAYEKNEYRWDKKVEETLKAENPGWFIRRGAEDLEHGPAYRTGLKRGDTGKNGLIGFRSGNSDFSEPYSMDEMKRIDQIGKSGSQAWSGYWTGYIEAPYTGEISFIAETASGLRFSIDDTPIIDGLGRGLDRDGGMQMEKGRLYSVRLFYFQDENPSSLGLYWSWSGQEKTLIENSAFSYGPENETHGIGFLENPLPQRGAPKEFPISKTRQHLVGLVTADTCWDRGGFDTVRLQSADHKPHIAAGTRTSLGNRITHKGDFLPALDRHFCSIQFR